MLRGKWVLENLLGAPPPPPPPNVPPLKENDGKSKPTALRERMEQHRANPVCASCHARMDPLGFALEHFDAIGKWRETDGGAEINSTITLDGADDRQPEGVPRGAAQPRRRVRPHRRGKAADLRARPRRRLSPTRRSSVSSSAISAQNDYRWSSLVLGIVKSAPFQMRRTTGAGDVTPAAGTSIGAQQQN